MTRDMVLVLNKVDLLPEDVREAKVGVEFHTRSFWVLTTHCVVVSCHVAAGCESGQKTPQRAQSHEVRQGPHGVFFWGQYFYCKTQALTNTCVGVNVSLRPDSCVSPGLYPCQDGRDKRKRALVDIGGWPC